MMRLSPIASRIVFCVLMVCVPLTASQCRKSARSGGLPPIDNESGPSFLSNAVTYCRDSHRNPVPAKVQILLDGSGSMTGYRTLVPDLVTWMQHGLSLLRGSTLQVTEGRVCQFATRFGTVDGAEVGECNDDVGRPLRSYAANTNTNLHLAIKSAADYDLTLILTDGVAATGSAGSGDCAAGVDAACVARSLRQVITRQTLDAGVAEWGFWLLPIVAPYDGTYFTEQVVPPESYDSQIAVDNVKRDIGGDPVIELPRTISDGTLVFPYRGPRAMVLIVLARNANLGRAAIETLMDRAEYLGIERLENLQDYSGVTGVLQPIEIFPGFVDRIKWKKLTPSQTVPSVGTIDVALRSNFADAQRPTLRVNCPPGGAGQGQFTLDGEVSRTTEVSGCVGILLLPAITFELRARGRDPGNEATALQSLVASFRRTDPGAYNSLDLHLTCGPQTQHSCASPLIIDWRAQMHYAEAADCMADPSCSGRAPDLLHGLSTTQASYFPHRIYGITETVEEFLRLTAENMNDQLVAELEACRGEG